MTSGSKRPNPLPRSLATGRLPFGAEAIEGPPVPLCRASPSLAAAEDRRRFRFFQLLILGGRRQLFDIPLQHFGADSPLHKCQCLHRSCDSANCRRYRLPRRNQPRRFCRLAADFYMSCLASLHRQRARFVNADSTEPFINSNSRFPVRWHLASMIHRLPFGFNPDRTYTDGGAANGRKPMKAGQISSRPAGL